LLQVSLYRKSESGEWELFHEGEEEAAASAAAEDAVAVSGTI
jgi:hypothetical protein